MTAALLPKHHGARTNGVPRYEHRRLTPEEFTKLRRASDLSIRDFMFITGRHSHLVAQFHGEAARNDQRPSMGDVLILELAKKHPWLVDEMIDIANSYSTGPKLKGDRS